MKKLVGLLAIALFSFASHASGPACYDLFKTEAPPEAKFEKKDVERVVRSSLDVVANERVTIQVMEMTARLKQKGADTLEGWLQSVRDTQSSQPLTALEHSALLFVHTSRVFQDHPNANVRSTLELALKESHETLVGRRVAEGAWRDGLPRAVLARANETARAFHKAVMDERAHERVGGLPRWRQKLTKENCITAVTTLVSVGGLFFESTRPFAAMMIGLAQASMNEHLIHIGIGHASEKLARGFRHFGGKPGRIAEQVTLAHRLHHAIVAENYGAVVLNEAQTARAEAILLRLSQGLVLDRMKETNPGLTTEQIRALPQFAKDVEHLVVVTRRGGYGINGTILGASSMLVTNAPWYLMNYAIYAATGDVAYLVMSNASLVAWTLQSLYSHRYLHIRPGDRGKVKTLWLQDMYMKTPLGRLQQKLHFVHHESPHPMGSTKNGAIMGGSVSDRMMMQLSEASVLNLVKYYNQGFLPHIVFTPD